MNMTTAFFVVLSVALTPLVVVVWLARPLQQPDKKSVDPVAGRR